MPTRFWWKIIIILGVAVLVSIPMMLFWITLSERFPFSTNLDVESFAPSLNVFYVNLTDSGKLVATLRVQMDYPQSNSTGVPVYFGMEQLMNTELDSITMSFFQYGYGSTNVYVDASSSISPDQFNISAQDEKSFVSSNNLGSYGIGNIALNFVLDLRHSYRGFGNSYDVYFRLWLSMHERVPIQLTSLKAQTDELLLYVSLWQ